MFISDPPTRGGGRGQRVLVSAALVVAAAVCVLVGTFIAGQLGSSAHAGHDDGPAGTDYVDITSVAPVVAAPKPIADASTGSYTENCGTNADGQHRNADNVVAAPRRQGSAQHIHDYVGNLSTTAYSTDASLAAAGTTCPNGDKSTYYWPVLLGRQSNDSTSVGSGSFDQILPVRSALIRYVGSPVSNVVPMPDFLRVIVGDPKALTDGTANSDKPKWTCTGYTDRVTRYYPLCPAGHDVLRIYDFPNCWNGIALDSPMHTIHVVAEAANGACPNGTFPVPQLTITLTYHVPTGTMFAIDSFPEDRRSPITDHAVTIEVMSDQLRTTIANCVNSGRKC